MKKIFTFIILFTISTSIFAQTQVQGNQSGTWTAANSPYEVTGEITIPAGEVLTIEAGVEVNFQSHYKFIVNGNLQAIGTEADSIFFTTNIPATGWGGIRVDTDNYNDIITLSYCRIEYGKTAGEYPDIHGGAIALLTSNAIITNCVFANNDATGSDNGMGGAIYGINTGDVGGEALTFITDCKFIHNHCYGEGGAIKFTSDGYTEITNCEFIENDCLYGGGAISLYSVVGTKMTKCLFVNNYTMYSNGGAIHMLGMGNTLFFENCTISQNSAATGDGGGIYIVNGTIDFVNCIVYNNSAMYGGVQGDNIYVYPDGSTATINYCDLIMPEYGATGNNNIDEDPLFVNAANGDFHLQESSPCIDAGTDIGYLYVGDAPDMGCYEYGYAEAPYVITYNPIQNAINVELSATVSVLFNEDISEVDFTGIEIRDEENNLITGISVQIEADNRTLTISHDDFAENTVYTVLIPENSVQNSAPLSNEEITWSFTTEIVENITEQNVKISIYPNPSNGIFEIKNEKIKIKNIKITDITGKTIHNLARGHAPLYIENAPLQIDISNQPTGIYFINIQTETGIYTEKLIIQ